MSRPENDAAFLARFRAAAIPRAEWDHAAHLRMAFLYLGRYELADAVRRIRRGIRRLNRANGVADTEASGYHETVTLAWVRLVAQRLAATPAGASFAEFIAGNPELLSQEQLLVHYSPERIDSPRARREFVLPDRAPLPAAVPAAIRKRSRGRKDSAEATAETSTRPTGHASERRTQS
jgi:hypothetical protein